MADISKLQSISNIEYTFIMAGANTYGSVSNVMMSTGKGDKKTYFNLEYSNLDISTVMQDENSKSYITFDFANKCYTYIQSTSGNSPLEVTLTTNDPNITVDGTNLVIGTVWINFTSSQAVKSTNVNWSYNLTQPIGRTIKDTQNRLSTVSVLNKMPSLLHPNNRYEDKKIGECSSTLEVEYFFNKYNHANGYDGLSLGNYITINDGLYNTDWMIAGFDYYKGKGGSTDNGYGMLIIPRTYLVGNNQSTWPMHSSNTTEGGFVGSTMYNSTLPSVASQIRSLIGDHCVTISIGLTNSVNTGLSKPNGLTGAAIDIGWYSKWVTLPSEYQIFGNSVFGNALEGGCDNIKIPVFNFIKHTEYARVDFWLRNVATSTAYSYASQSGDCWYADASRYMYLRPIFYVR